MSDALEQIKKLLGPTGVVAAGDQGPFLTEWRDKFSGKPALVVQPVSTEEVSLVMRLAYEAGIGVVPQSGNTGLVGGQMPSAKGDQVLLNLSRMNAIQDVDLSNDTMTVEAGVILQSVQEKAEASGRLFPLSLASEGSAQIGGLLSTNAGGVNVLKYGNARAQVLGLEVVLPDGRIWDGLRGLRKDNTGYDLKQLFLGAEGTLGIITGAVLKLFPRPREIATCMMALPDLKSAPELLAFARERLGDQVNAFELIPRLAFEFLAKHANLTSPLATVTDWSILMDFENHDPDNSSNKQMERFLERALESGLIVDATPARSLAQSKEFWQMREMISGIQKPEGGSIKHDISVAISDIPAFVERASKAVGAACLGIRPVIFGHVGDGNLHFNLTQPEGADTQDYLARWPELTRLVHDIVADMNGSISAEHGIGQLKREDLVRYKSDVELDLMRAVKAALDPKGIMNPGKLV